MNFEYIQDAINKKVDDTDIEGKPDLKRSEKYGDWTIGITNDVMRRKGEHANTENVKRWKSWFANTEETARTVEDYFHDCGMKGGDGGGTNPIFVYIF